MSVLKNHALKKKGRFILAKVKAHLIVGLPRVETCCDSLGR